MKKRKAVSDMARYYEESALIELIKNKQLIFEESTPVDEAIASQIDAVIEGIGELPAADVVPAAIGEWLENEDGCQCSHCGLQQYGEYDAECMPEFCPSCFARMYCKLDGEEYAKVERFRREKEARLAREIFEEIEDECLAYPIQDDHPTILVDARAYNELKKKYTEGTDGKQA